jgi:hypothetical protein
MHKRGVAQKQGQLSIDLKKKLVLVSDIIMDPKDIQLQKDISRVSQVSVNNLQLVVRNVNQVREGNLNYLYIQNMS